MCNSQDDRGRLLTRRVIPKCVCAESNSRLGKRGEKGKPEWCKFQREGPGNIFFPRSFREERLATREGSGL